MSEVLKSKLSSLAIIAVIVGLIVTVLATRNRDTPYAPAGLFVGCYSDNGNRLLLRASGGLEINGTTVGSYRILKPVGGKHGYLVHAEGLTLNGGMGTVMRATRGNAGFYWPINDETLHVLFAPDVSLTLRKMPVPSC